MRHAVLIRVTALGVALLVALPDSPKAQVTDGRPRTGLRALHALDSWLVSRYRRVQLLPDSLMNRVVLAEELAPRVESASDAITGDTLFATQFRTRPEMTSLRTGARVRLTGPSGSITVITAEIIARRPFRAPRRPGGDTSVTGWRYGWAYLAQVRRQHATTSATAYRGWSLLPAPDTLRRR